MRCCLDKDEKIKTQATPNRQACLVVVASYINDPLRKLNFKETDVLYCCQVITGVPFKMDFVRNTRDILLQGPLALYCGL